MRERISTRERVVHALEFNAPTSFDSLQITLFPAGHIFGSAQLLAQSDSGSLLYTGDFKLRPSLSSEPIQWCQADTLIMETTFGLPKFRFPPTEQVLAQVIGFCNEALEENAVPVLFGYSLGKSQEILCALQKAGLSAMLHSAVHQITKVYQQLRPDFPDFERFDPKNLSGKVLIAPPSAIRSHWLRQIRNRRTAFLSGWAIEKGARFRYQSDAVFPLSDHADYDDLLRYVELVGPKRVLTLHGFASAFANDLRQRGIEAWALSQENQLQFRFVVPEKLQSCMPHRGAHPDSRFGLIATVAEEIAASTSKLRKVEILKTFFNSLSAEELAIAAVYLGGRPFPQTDARVLQIGWAAIKRALIQVSNSTEQEYRRISHLHSDPGKVTLDLLSGHTKPEPWDILQSRSFFIELERTRGPIQKSALLADRFSRLSPLEAAFLVKILTGDLRIGLKEGLVEEAIAAAFKADSESVRKAHMLTGDLGQTALLARENALHTATPQLFRPLQCMLANPEPNAQALWQRCANGHFWVEDKFDGIRAQLHVDMSRSELFSRDLKRLSEQFPELIHAAKLLEHAAVFDGEIIAFDLGKPLTFFDLQKRLGRRESDLFMTTDIPVRYVIFDLLWLDGRSLLDQTLQQRRDLLEQIPLPPAFERAEVTRISSAAEIAGAFQKSRGRGNEGLIAKDAASTYTLGRRGLAWLKLKQALATLDVVVVGAEYGHGKRSGVLSDYTFAVRDEQSGALLPIGKAYTGLTDQEISELTEHFLANSVAVTGRYHEVTPHIVLEVAFDSIQPSRRHASGLALRFPRIKAVRRDKSPADIDTLDYARSLLT